MSNEITESLGDFNTQWIFSQYEAGKSVAEIAAGMKVCKSAVYARMRMRPKTCAGGTILPAPATGAGVVSKISL